MPGTRLGLAEMIRGGTTTYCDMYYFEDAIADETKKAGVRGVLGETVIDFPVADNKTDAEAMAYTERFIKKWKNDPLIVPAIAPHAPYTVSTDHLKAIRALSDRLNAAVVIHVAETKKERDDIKKQYGDTPVDYLEQDRLSLEPHDRRPRGLGHGRRDRHSQTPRRRRRAQPAIEYEARLGRRSGSGDARKGCRRRPRH